MRATDQVVIFVTVHSKQIGEHCIRRLHGLNAALEQVPWYFGIVAKTMRWFDWIGQRGSFGRACVLQCDPSVGSGCDQAQNIVRSPAKPYDLDAGDVTAQLNDITPD